MTKRIEKMNIELAGNYADELKTLVSSSEKIACYEFEHNDGDQIWTDCTEFYKNADGTYKKVFTDGWNGSKSECTVSLDDIRQMVNKCKII